MTKVLIVVPSRLLLEQFAPEFPSFCKVGTGYNKNMKKQAPGFIAVSDSVHLLQDLAFKCIILDEAHHPLPAGLPRCEELYHFSATHRMKTDFRYNMGQAIEDGVLCDYDLTVPVLSKGHAYVCLANLLLSNAGRFRRVLAYCNSVLEAKRVRRSFEILGMAAWHMNSHTGRKKRQEVIEEFSGNMRKPVHVLVTVQVLGEGVNIPNVDTCMFVEPRSSYTVIVQAMGRVLRQHISKPLAHIILPAVAVPPTNSHKLESTAFDAKSQLHGSFSSGDTGHFSSNVVQSHEVEVMPCRTGQPAYESSRTTSARVPSSSKRKQTQKPACGKQAGMSDWERDERTGVQAEGAKHGSSSTKSPPTEGLFAGNLVRTTLPASADKANSASKHVPHAQDSFKIRKTCRCDNIQVRKKLRLPSSVEQGAEGFGSQLERFLSAIARADGFLLNAPSSLRFRLGFADCRSLPGADLASITHNVRHELVTLLRSRGRDPWDTRVQELEDFVRQHGRLPTPTDAKHKPCKSLFYWLKNVGSHMRRLSAKRQAQLLNSPVSKISLRAKGWLDPDFRFRKNCERLRLYIDRVQSVPKTAQNKAEEGRYLAGWLQSQRRTVLDGSDSRRNARRCEMLAAAHPLIADYVESWRQRRIPKVRHDAEQRWLELSRFVSEKGRLPRSAEDYRLYQYLRRLWRRFPGRSMEEQRQLLNAQPLLASYFQTATRKRTSAFELLKSGATT